MKDNFIVSVHAAKLAVTTPSRHAPCRGRVQVETVEGGVGVSSLEFAFVETEIAVPPEVSGISPREGSIQGGQRVILRGNNLGECKEGVVRVVVADVDCTETLEYFSPCKHSPAAFVQLLMPSKQRLMRCKPP